MPGKALNQPRKRPFLVGVLNVTPDSFSDGGDFFTAAAVAKRAAEMFEQGADFVEVGGESTAPGSSPVTFAEELARVKPVLEKLSKLGPVAIDTYKSQVAHYALELGAQMVNDVSALRADPEMAHILRDHSCKVVVMHSKESGPTPHVTLSPRSYTDIVEEIAEFLQERAEFCLSHGISEDRIILDPGMGKFISLDPRDSWELLRRFEELAERVKPFPLMIACSRKGFLGGETGDRDLISQIVSFAAVRGGAAYVRTHDIGMAQLFRSTILKLEGADND
ncbi:MAG: dihydropteroate synthase [Proteobacteria bacterium]|nr:MAG: dihydropteroate synthase [Pseudomonadota bacterium]